MMADYHDDDDYVIMLIMAVKQAAELDLCHYERKITWPGPVHWVPLSNI